MISEAKREYMAKWRADNKDRLRANQIAYRAVNREKIIERERKYREANAEKRQTYAETTRNRQKAYREANRDIARVPSVKAAELAHGIKVTEVI